MQIVNSEVQSLKSGVSMSPRLSLLSLPSKAADAFSETALMQRVPLADTTLSASVAPPMYVYLSKQTNGVLHDKLKCLTKSEKNNNRENGVLSTPAVNTTHQKYVTLFAPQLKPESASASCKESEETKEKETIINTMQSDIDISKISSQTQYRERNAAHPTLRWRPPTPRRTLPFQMQVHVS